MSRCRRQALPQRRLLPRLPKVSMCVRVRTCTCFFSVCVCVCMSTYMCTCAYVRCFGVWMRHFIFWIFNFPIYVHSYFYLFLFSIVSPFGVTSPITSVRCCPRRRCRHCHARQSEVIKTYLVCVKHALVCVSLYFKVNVSKHFFWWKTFCVKGALWKGFCVSMVV